MSATEQIIPVLPFALLISAAALHGLAASGHLPRQHDGVHPGAAKLFGSMATTLLALVAGSAAALRLASWPAAIIAGGLSLLFAPLLLRIFPDRFIDGAGALIAFTAATLAAAAALIWLATRCGASC
jgi:hypothetical protein